MKISSSTVIMSGQSITAKSYTKEETLKFWARNREANSGGRRIPAERLLDISKEAAKLSEQAKAVQSGENTSLKVQEIEKTTIFEIKEEDKQKLLMLQKLIEALTGKKIKFYILEKVELERNKTTHHIQPERATPQIPQGYGWSMEYDYHQLYSEKEKMSFVAQGTIKTLDGQEINFSAQLNMSREFLNQQDIRVRAGDGALTDPIVINFSGTAPQLTENKFYFDLDCDGKDELLPFTGPGSGFLALDLNGDGMINNGRELFGTATGNGFAELAYYDEDDNQWIDENDPVYDHLRIWTKDAAGQNVLFALGQKGIGAIYLGNLDTLFTMKDHENNLKGQIRKTGIYVGENGSAGTLQQIDIKA